MSTQEEPGAWRLLNPVVVIALLIIIGIFALIGAAILGIDRGVLISMSRIEFARGLITYLFAVVTIGTAVVLVVSALTNEPTPEVERRFQHGKEILALLLGIFGTIVGYYFGSDSGAKVAGAFQITQPLLSPQHASVGNEVTITAAAMGGTPPYSFHVFIGGERVADDKVEVHGDWVTASAPIPPTKTPSTTIEVTATDESGNTRSSTTKFAVDPEK